MTNEVPKRILILANDTTYVFNCRKELIDELMNRGYQITVACEILFYEDELKHMGCRLIHVATGRRKTNPIHDILLCFRYLSIIWKEKPDAVLSFNIKPNCYGGLACRLTRTPYFPNITGLGTAVETPGRMQKLTIQLYRLGTYGAKTIFFQNNENLKFFRIHRMLSEKSKVVLLPGSGVALERYPVMPFPDGDDVHFLFASRILEEKGILLYLNTAKYIHGKYPNAIFHICGKCDDEKYNEILKQAELDGYVMYHGEQKGMQQWYSKCACLVHPSYYPEGMSNVLLEAASTGRPVITTDRSGCRETVDDGISGFIIPIKNQEALNEALDRFMELSTDERKAMGLAGRAKMEREYDRRLVVASYLKEIEAEQVGLISVNEWK
ncbi:MAG: glycosyltransferase family 4 protein [Clostridiales bacterium]|nr:glycosyltransferase family 4 protein [Clostridiales bacterium]